MMFPRARNYVYALSQLKENNIKRQKLPLKVRFPNSVWRRPSHTKGTHARSKDCHYFQEKIDIKILTEFLSGCERYFFVKKNTLNQNIDSSNLLDIFWWVVNILTTLQYFDACEGSYQNSDKKISPQGNIQPKPELRQRQHPDQTFSTQWILVKILMERVWAIWRQKSHRKLELNFLFLIVYGVLLPQTLQTLRHRCTSCVAAQNGDLETLLPTHKCWVSCSAALPSLVCRAVSVYCNCKTS